MQLMQNKTYNFAAGSIRAIGHRMLEDFKNVLDICRYVDVL